MRNTDNNSTQLNCSPQPVTIICNNNNNNIVLLRQHKSETQREWPKNGTRKRNNVRIQSGRSRQIIMGVASISREDIIIWFSRSPNQHENKWNCKTQSTRCTTYYAHTRARSLARCPPNWTATAHKIHCRMDCVRMHTRIVAWFVHFYHLAGCGECECVYVCGRLCVSASCLRCFYKFIIIACIICYTNIANSHTHRLIV